jgi:dipeptidyl aminopeptidase/acylaminoacyl peptidase
VIFTIFVPALLALFGYSQQVPTSRSKSAPLTLDEYFEFVDYSRVAMSPDGHNVVIATERADWKEQRYRADLWLWRDGMTDPELLTNSGHDSDPRWSPDGKWIAFISDRRSPEGAAEEEENVPKEPPVVPTPKRRDGDADEKNESSAQVYVISTSGGEAIPVTRGIEDVHAFVWAPDSTSIYFATRPPWNKAKRDAYKKEWKDVIRFRESERGDVIARIAIRDVIARVSALPQQDRQGEPKKAVETAETPGSVLICSNPHRVADLAVSPDGKWLAFNTDSVSQRVEGISSYEIYLVSTGGGQAKQLTHNQAIESRLRWTPDGRSILFEVGMGSVEHKYEDLQKRLYSVDVESGAVRRWAGEFSGAIEDWAVNPQGGVVATGRLGTEVPIYSAAGADAKLQATQGWKGTYQKIATSRESSRVAFVYSALDRPTEVYVAESLDKLAEAKPITAFNRHYAEHPLPQGKPYQWKADDGTTVEGMLLYPPGKFGEKNLPMFVFIHGGPADADGNKFGADWYDWAILAASKGWLVFRPNYRGSSGYGDKFQLEIVPKLVSRPGKDILEGVDALVKDGAADPNRLAIGGYSYGGYMTNWLITQTTRFKAAVTGAGAVEHAANWGNDDLTFDDAFYLGGTPWQVPNNYNSEAALFQFDKVKTPTHVVGGAADIRVAAAENYLLERALNAVGVPNSLLIFPGEGHPLAKNPWHGKIKVREELKWLDQYALGRTEQ